MKTIKVVEDEKVCCNGDCNQGRDCPLRKDLPKLSFSELCALLYVNMDWRGYLIISVLCVLLFLNMIGVIK